MLNFLVIEMYLVISNFKLDKLSNDEISKAFQAIDLNKKLVL